MITYYQTHINNVISQRDLTNSLQITLCFGLQMTTQTIIYFNLLILVQPKQIQSTLDIFF